MVFSLMGIQRPASLQPCHVTKPPPARPVPCHPAKAKRDFGWTLRYPSRRQGFVEGYGVVGASAGADFTARQPQAT
jgi:hypothetical protein